MNTFGCKLKSIRKAKKLTICQLASLCGCSTGLISDLENDKRSPTLDTVYHFCSALSVPISYFVSESYSETVHTTKADYLTVYRTKDTRYELLTPQGYCLRVLRMTWLPTAREYNTFSWGHNSDEVGVVIQGKIEIHESDDEGNLKSYVVSAGETFYQRAHINHSVHCVSDIPCIAYWFFSASSDFNPKGFNH